MKQILLLLWVVIFTVVAIANQIFSSVEKHINQLD